jgi:hypothetical protein
MALKPGRKKKTRPKFWWLNPDVLLDFAYAIHASGDISHGDSIAREIAKEQARVFLALTAEVGTADWTYLVEAKGIVTSHSLGITRRKRNMLDDLAAAGKRYLDMNEQLKGSRNQSMFINVLYSKAGLQGMTMALVAGIGYFLAQTIGPFLTTYLPMEARQGRAPSILMGLVFAGIAKYVNSVYSDFRTTRISDIYREAIQMARLTYEEGKLDEYKVHRAELCLLWQKYTGKKYPQTPRYEMVLEADVRTEQLRKVMSDESARSGVVIIFQKIRRKLPWPLKTKDKQTAALIPAAQ